MKIYWNWHCLSCFISDLDENPTCTLETVNKIGSAALLSLQRIKAASE